MTNFPDKESSVTKPCPYTSAEECYAARERSVAGISNIIPSCVEHDIDRPLSPLEFAQLMVDTTRHTAIFGGTAEIRQEAFATMRRYEAQLRVFTSPGPDVSAMLSDLLSRGCRVELFPAQGEGHPGPGDSCCTVLLKGQRYPVRSEWHPRFELALVEAFRAAMSRLVDHPSRCGICLQEITKLGSCQWTDNLGNVAGGQGDSWHGHYPDGSRVEQAQEAR